VGGCDEATSHFFHQESMILKNSGQIFTILLKIGHMYPLWGFLFWIRPLLPFDFP
jgi:hypothetical protein